MKKVIKYVNNNINSYINILIGNNDFLNELFSHSDFKYYTNHNNEVLKLLSDNTESDDTFNISKNYKIFKKSHLLVDLAELPLVSLGQEPLGGANHNQKTSKSGGAFPANHLL